MNSKSKSTKDISADWVVYYSELEISEREYFTLESALGAQDPSRYYIRSHDLIFREYFRSIMLPGISYISILKLKDSNGSISFLFRPALSYNFNPYYHPARERQVKEAIEAESIPKEKKFNLIRAREGQGEYERSC